MSVCQTIKTRTGIKRFLLPPKDGEECVTGFEYTDKKIEAHILKRECAPLYLEENTALAEVTSDQIGTLLLAVTHFHKQGKGWCLNFRAWDAGKAASSLGFTPKEIQVQDAKKNTIQDGKFKAIVILPEEPTVSSILIDSLASYISLVIEHEVIMIWRVQKIDSGAIAFDFVTTINMKGKSTISAMNLLQINGVHHLILGENGSLTVFSLNNDGNTEIVASIALHEKTSGGNSLVESFHRISSTQCILTDDTGRLWTFGLDTLQLTAVKLPSSIGGHGIFSAIQAKKNNTGILAVCNEGHTINLYAMQDIIGDTSTTCSLYQKPVKVLFSNVPINSLVFVRYDTLAVASSSNRTISFWAGLNIT